MRPFVDMIAIRMEQKDSITAGGIHVPESDKVEMRTGVVISVGPGMASQSGFINQVDLEKGQRVLFMRPKCVRINLNGDDIYMAKPAAIVATLEPLDKVDVI